MPRMTNGSKIEPMPISASGSLKGLSPLASAGVCQYLHHSNSGSQGPQRWCPFCLCDIHLIFESLLELANECTTKGKAKQPQSRSPPSTEKTSEGSYLLCLWSQRAAQRAEL